MYLEPIITLFTDFNSAACAKKKETRGMYRKTNASRYRIAVIRKGIYGPR